MDQTRIAELQKKVEQDFDLSALSELIQIYEHEQNYQGLEELYLKLYHHNPQNSSVVQALAFLYDKNLQQADQARKFYEMALTLEPNDPSLHFHYGALLEFKFKAFNQAMEAYKETIRLDQHFVDAYLNLSWAYLEYEQNVEQGLDIVLQGLKHNERWELYSHVAYIHYTYTENYPLALTYLEKALELSPKNSLVLTYMGQVYLAMEHPDKAYEAFKRAHATGELNPILIYELVKLLMTYYKNFDEAIELLKEAVTTFPDQAIYSSYLASIYLSIGNLEQAGRYLQVAEDASEKNQDSLLLIGYLKAILGSDPADAMLYFEKLVELNPNHLNALSIVGFYNLFNQQQIDVALEYFNRIIDLGAAVYPIYFLVAQIYEEYYQDYHKALATYQKIDRSKLGKEDLAYLNLIIGKLFQNGFKDVQTALEYYEQAYELNPSSQVEQLINQLYTEIKALVN